MTSAAYFLLGLVLGCVLGWLASSRSRRLALKKVMRIAQKNLPFSLFTDRAKKVMNFARQEAQGSNHKYLGTEHILLGLVREGSGVAAHVLGKMGMDLEKIRMDVEEIVEPASSMVTMGQLPFTPEAKKVLELCMEESGTLGHNYFGTEHLLLGLIKENEGIAARVLLNNGLELNDARERVRKFLSADD